MPTARVCERCGQAVSNFAPAGLCPHCLLTIETEAGPVGSSPSASAPEVASGSPPRLRYFGDYELLEEIARGGMGVVYKARQVSLNRIVAVKMVLFGRLASAADVQRFQHEAEAAAHLQHPNIVAIHEVGEHEGRPYFSMDFVEGQNLAEWVREHPLPAKRAAGYLKIIAEAIYFAHQQGVLHRDLKPSNILIDQHDQPRVTDFGLAKRLTNSELETQNSELTLTGQVLGSPNYMPPEQASARHQAIGPHSDIYSLGAVLYYLLTGRPPFVAATVPITLRQVLEQDPVPPRLLNPVVPRDLETLCLKCLNKEPHRRYATAQALADELGRFLRDEPIHARPSSPLEKAWRWCRRKPMIASLAAGVAVLLLAVAIGSAVASARIANQRRRADQNAERELNLWLSNAQVLLKVGKPLEAVASLTHALERWPNQPVIWNAKAAAEEQAGHWEAARQSYSRGIDLAERSGATNHLELARKSLAPLLRRSGFQGLLGWWRGERSAADEVSNQPGAVLNGTTFAPGKVGDAFSFDGVDDHVLIPPGPRLSITGALSILVWIKPQQLTSSFILAKVDRSVPDRICYWLQMHDNGVISLGVMAPSGAGRETFSALEILEPGLWRHLAGTFDPTTQEQRIYVNGMPVPGSLHGDSRVISAVRDNQSPVFLGVARKAAGETAGTFSGLIDEVKLYGRVLSPAEIEADFRTLAPSRSSVPAR